MKKFTLKFFISSVMSLLFSIGLIAQTTITFQPNAIDGKDATTFSITPDRKAGSFQNIQSEAWTFSGTPGTSRSFFEFDLSQIPANSTITKAYLSLYYAPQPDGDGHSTLSGSNDCLIQRITSDWDESLITWNNSPSTTSLNQVEIAQSTTSTQDYIDIDVTTLVQDMIQNPDSSYGFMLRLETEEYYRRMVFASSDYADSTLHPKLEVEYLYSDSCSTIIYDIVTVYDTIQVYDTITVQDTIQVYHDVYQYTSVSDTLIIDLDIANQLINTTAQIKIYPNPTNDYITISTGNYTEIADYRLRIVNIQGKVVFENFVNEPSFSINLSEFDSKGLFLVELYNASNKKVETKKIILK